MQEEKLPVFLCLEVEELSAQWAFPVSFPSTVGHQHDQTSNLLVSV